MRTPQRKPDRAAIARSLQQLNWLFRKPPDRKNAQRELGADTAEIKLQANDSTKNGGAI